MGLRIPYDAPLASAEGALILRFDDSLDTVLTADMSTAFGAQTAWRQLVDLIGRGRAPASDIAIARLRSIRPQVPATIRAASARALAFARPPAPLVRLFAEEDLAISAPVLRMADLSTAEWIAMLPDMSSAGRSVLRHRRDLSAEVGRALETYGPIDFILPAAEKVPLPVVVEALPVTDAAPIAGDVVHPEPIAPPTEPIADMPIEAPALLADEMAADVMPEADAASVPIAVEDAPWMPLAANDVDAAPKPVEALNEMPVVDAPTIYDSVPEPEPEPIYEPLSIDWTAVIAARPKEPGAAAFKPRPLNLPANPSAYAPPVKAPLPTPAPAPPAPIVPVLAPAITLAPPVIDYAPPHVDETAAEPATSAAETTEQVGAWSFVSIASVAFGLPVVVEALRQQDQSATPAPDGVADASVAPDANSESAPAVDAIDDAHVDHLSADELPVVATLDADTTPVETPPIDEPTEPAAAEVTPRGPFQISDLVARIDAFQRLRDEEGRADADAAIANDTDAPLPTPEGFSFETDARGVILWVSGVSRAALIGVSLDAASHHEAAQVDGVAAGAFRRRSPFAQARLVIAGQSDAAGQWRIAGVPVFDKATGRFTGYRGTARRPRADERAEPQHAGRSPATDSLRQLVHELRTPTTAIAGFAEMIEGELLGPVSGPYRDYAGTIRDQAMGLLGAIDDLDTAARIEAHALDLRPTDVPVALLLQRIALDLEPLAEMRGTVLSLDIAAGDVAIRGDDRAVERLFARLLAALVAAGSAGETIAVRMGREGEETVAIHIDRPRALAAYAGDALLTIDAEAESEATGAPLLGTGFALRLARNLAVELGGSLTIGVDRLTLRLPAAFTHSVGQASTI